MPLSPHWEENYHSLCRMLTSNINAVRWNMWNIDAEVACTFIVRCMFSKTQTIPPASSTPPPAMPDRAAIIKSKKRECQWITENKLMNNHLIEDAVEDCWKLLWIMTIQMRQYAPFVYMSWCTWYRCYSNTPIFAIDGRKIGTIWQGCTMCMWESVGLMQELLLSFFFVLYISHFYVE